MNDSSTFSLCLFLVLASNCALAQPTTRRASTSFVGIADNPVRMAQNQIIDFTPAIKWYQNDPRRTMSGNYAMESPLRQEFERRKKLHAIEGQKWQRYLISQGSIGERLPEGVIIKGIPVTRVVQDGYAVASRSGQTAPRYKTIHTTKEILLKNAPERFSMPLFAFPMGRASIGVALLEAYDYGKPVQLATPSQIQQRQTNTAARMTNVSTTARALRATNNAASPQAD